jgi:hypothetical protein
MKRVIIAFLHLLFWLVYLFMMMVIMYVLIDGNEEIQQLGEENIAQLVLSMVLLPALISFYLFYFFFFPRYFQQKQILKGCEIIEEYIPQTSEL